MRAAHTRNRTLLALTLCAVALAAPAEVYRCLGPDGQVSFSDRACPPGAQQRVEPVTVYNQGWNGAAIMDANRALLGAYDARIERERGRAARAAAMTEPRHPRPRWIADPVPDEPEPAAVCDETPKYFNRPPPGVSTYGPPSRFPPSPRAPMNLR